MKKLLIISILLLTVVSYGHAQKDDARYHREFAEFLDHSIAGDFVRFMKEEMDDYIARQDAPTAAKMLELMPAMEELFDNFVSQEIMPMYREHLTYKDLKKINKFYRSQPGKVLHKAQLPVLMGMMEKTEQLTRSVMDLISESMKE